jgi:polyphenol oxidase
MLRFSDFENLGPRIAAFTERSDGDGAGESGRKLVSRLLTSLDMELEPIRFLQQVHGTHIIELGKARGEVEADGVISNIAGLPMAIRVADCVPIYLYSPEARAGGLLHAGWRGTLEDIAGRGIQSLESSFGCRPETVHALIGPSAGPQKYEVSNELAQDFTDAGLVAQGRYVDLWESNVMLLRSAGLRPENIVTTSNCTIADTRFYSHRRDRDEGRNIAILVL